jgi:putative photosynthetic complex assembly protein
MAMTDPRRDSRPEDKEKIPPILIKGMFGVALFSLLLVTWARITDRPLDAMPDIDAPVAVERQIVIDGKLTGAATVYDDKGNVVYEFTPENGGFVAGVWRAVELKRKQAGVPLDAPVRLVRYESGRMSLFDDLTGWRAELIGFGPDHAAAFAQLLK